MAWTNIIVILVSSYGFCLASLEGAIQHIVLLPTTEMLHTWTDGP